MSRTDKIIYAIIIILIFLSAAVYFLENYRSQREGTRAIIGNKELLVEIADSPREHQRGLSGRESLEKDRGMLFVLAPDSNQSFWMKDMNFPIDIIWIDNGRVVSIDKNLDFNDQKTLYSPGKPIDYVIEVNAGWSDENSIKTGDRVVIKK